MDPRAPVFRARSIEEALRMIHSIRDDYASNWRNVLNMFLPLLELPSRPGVFEPEESSIAEALLSLSATVEIVCWCGTHPQSPIAEATMARVYDIMDGCLYWCLRALRIPATSDSMPPSESFSEGDSGTKCYLLPVHLLDLFARFYQDLLKKEATLHVAIAFWTGLYDDRVPLYRNRSRDPDYFLDQEELGISVFFAIAKANPKGLCDAIMNGRVCTPEMFVTRTRQRLVGLLQIHRLPYLSESITTPTVEITNIVRVVNTIETLSDQHADLRTIFLQQGAPKVCLETAKGMSERFSLLIAKKVVSPTWPFTGDEGERTAVSKNALLTLPVAGALKMAEASPKATLSEIKKVFEAGAAEVAVRMFVTVLPWPKAMRGRVDELWEAIERYGLYLEILPAVVKGLRTRALPPETMPNLGVGRQDLPELSKKIMALETFVKHRVRLCDNLRHGGRTSNSSGLVSPKECARCRSMIYCSRECQREDWDDHHRSECAHMSRNSANRKFLDRRYTHHNRAFHATLLRHSFETHAQRQDLKPSAVPQSFGRDSVVYIDIHRSGNTESYSLEAYATDTVPLIPPSLRKRFDSYISEFKDANGTYTGRDVGMAKKQNARLIEGRFRYGSEDVNLLVLLRKTGTMAFKGTPTERKRQMVAFEARGPTAKSKFAVQGALVYHSQPRSFPHRSEPEPEAVRNWTWNGVNIDTGANGTLRGARPNTSWLMPNGLN